MKIIGIVGNIASGKTFFANILKLYFNAYVFNADKFVHHLYFKNKKVINEIAKIAPGCMVNQSVNRKILLNLILQDYSILKKVEEVVHPLVIKELYKLKKLYTRNRLKILVLDIPLLYKINADLICDRVFYIKLNKVIHSSFLKKRPIFQGFLLESKRLKRSIHNKVIKIQSGIGPQDLIKQISYIECKLFNKRLIN